MEDGQGCCVVGRAGPRLHFKENYRQELLEKEKEREKEKEGNCFSSQSCLDGRRLSLQSTTRCSASHSHFRDKSVGQSARSREDFLRFHRIVRMQLKQRVDRGTDTEAET